MKIKTKILLQIVMVVLPALLFIQAGYVYPNCDSNGRVRTGINARKPDWGMSSKYGDFNHCHSYPQSHNTYQPGRYRGR